MTMADTETKDIPGFLGYRAGVDGKIWSSLSGEWKELKGHLVNGYVMVSFFSGEKGHRKENYTLAHIQVLRTFVGECPDGMECRHLDGTRDNNRLDNLVWGTPTQNAADRTSHGRSVRGSTVPNAKLHESDIPLILDMYAKGQRTQDIAPQFNVTNGAIWFVVKGIRWKHASTPSETTP
jgi:hypothetical protein